MIRRSLGGADVARLPAWRLALFASLAVPLAAAGLPLAVYLPAFYAQSLGLGVVGAIFMLTRIWDTFSDPLIGMLSDRTRSRFGRRKPWIAAGGVLFAVSAAAVFLPAGKPSPAYLAGWLFLFYLGWAMIQIPLLAWSGALSAQYHERSRVQTYLQTAGAGGLLAVLILPTLLDQGVHPSAAANVRAMGLFTLATLAPSLLAVLFLHREPAQPPTGVWGKAAAPHLPFLQGLKAVAADKLVLRVLASDFAVTLGQTIRGSLFVFFVSAYLGLPRWASALFLLQFVFGVFAAPLWLQVGYRLGKSRTAIFGEAAQIAINLGLLFALPGGLGFVLVLTIAQGLAQGSGNLMLRAMVADLADRQRLETGEERSGLLFSAFSMASKLATAVAVGVALPLVAVLGFHPAGHNTPHALLGLKLVFALGPALSHAVSAALIARFPLDQRHHAEIRERLDRRDLGAAPLPIPAE